MGLVLGFLAFSAFANLAGFLDFAKTNFGIPFQDFCDFCVSSAHFLRILRSPPYCFCIRSRPRIYPVQAAAAAAQGATTVVQLLPLATARRAQPWRGLLLRRG